MKITRAELKSIINEVLNEAETDKFQRQLQTLYKKRQGFLVQAALVLVKIHEVKLAQAQEKQQTASDALDAAEARGEDTSKESTALDDAKEGVRKATESLTAARNSLKAAQKGGGVN